MSEWEYKVIPTHGHANDLFHSIVRAGKDGWELVGPIGYLVYLKRPTTPTKGAASDV